MIDSLTSLLVWCGFFGFFWILFVQAWIADTLSRGSLHEKDISWLPHVTLVVLVFGTLWCFARLLVVDLMFGIIPWGKDLLLPEEQVDYHPWILGEN